MTRCTATWSSWAPQSHLNSEPGRGSGTAQVTAVTAERGPKPQGRGRWQRGRCRGTKPRPPPAPRWSPPKPPQHPPSCSAPLGPCPGGGAGADPVPGTRGSAKLERRGGEGKGGPGAARRRGDTAPTRPSPGRRPGASRSPKRLPGMGGDTDTAPGQGPRLPGAGAALGARRSGAPGRRSQNFAGRRRRAEPPPRQPHVPAGRLGTSMSTGSRLSTRAMVSAPPPPSPGSPQSRSGAEQSAGRRRSRQPGLQRPSGRAPPAGTGAAPRGHGAGRGEALAPARDVPEAPQGSLSLPPAPLLPRQRERPKGQQPGAALSAVSSLSESVFFNTTKTIFTVSLKRTFPLQHIYKEVCLPVFSATLRQRKQVFSLRENKNTQQITASVSRQHFQVALPMIPKSASELFSTFHKNTGVSITSSL